MRIKLNLLEGIFREKKTKAYRKDESTLIRGIYGRDINIDDALHEITINRNATNIIKMWKLSKMINREIGAGIYDNGTKLFINSFILGGVTSVSIHVKPIKGAIDIGTMHTHPGGFRDKPKFSKRDIDTFLSTTDRMKGVIEGYDPKILFLFNTNDVYNSDLFLSFVNGGDVDEEGDWYDFTDKELKELISKLTERDIELEDSFVSIPPDYYCSICRRRHKITSGIGKWHIEEGFGEIFE